MYKANGIELTGGEYEELRALVESKDRAGLAESHLRPDGGPFDSDAVQLYRSLLRKKLIVGSSFMGGFDFRGVTIWGDHWVADYDEQARREARERRERRNHDFLVALFGAVSGGLLGLFSGALASLLYDLLLR